MSARKNILLFMVDQLRWDAVFDDCNPCRMPNVLRLAERGVQFDRAYSICPLCSPARGALFTGLLPHQNGLMDNTGTRVCPERTLHPEHKTYLERLQANGYNVSYSGKWHCGNGSLVSRGVADVRCSDGGSTHEAEPHRPQKLKLTGEWFKPYYMAYSEGRNQDWARVQAGKEQVREGMARFRETGTPFCSVVSVTGPHFAHCIPQKYAEMYELPEDFVPDNFCEPFAEPMKPHVLGRPHWPSQDTTALTRDDWRKTAQHYWGYCSYIDDLFSEVLQLLDEVDLWADTVVAFTPDHGEMLGAHGRFDKGPDFYEETVHIPLVIWDPAGREPRSRDSFVNLVDLFPTLLSLAGATDVLSNAEAARSMWETAHRQTFMCYDAYQGRHFMLRGIRTDRYKYSWRPRDLDELYDMQEDPGERINLIDSPEHSEVAAELKAELDAWMEREGDYLRHARYVPEPGSYWDGRPYDTTMVVPEIARPKRGKD
jgi:arylsulfatase A-like enzyme